MIHDKYDNVFLFTGYPASGKSTALEVANKNFDSITAYEMSDVVRSMFQNADTISESVNDNALGEWASSLKAKHGNGYFAEELAHEIATVEPDIRTDNVAVSGIRSPAEVMAFVEHDSFRSVTVIAVVANEDVRWERYSKRNESDPKEFAERNTREEDWGTDTVIRNADLYLTNEYITEHRFRLKVENIIENLLEHPVQSWSESYSVNV